MAPSPGQSLLQYRFVEEIGAGSMGVVWKATDTSLDREVAVKLLTEAVAEDPVRLARLEREAKLLASLSHPNLAVVYGVHEVDGTRFLAMELVPGADLSVRLEQGPLPVDEAVSIARRIADAIEAAHDRGVIHRDLKPGNVRITPDGRVKVLDFGLAKALQGGADDGEGARPKADLAETKPGVILGTAPYMSPEQARGGVADARSDIWSFGCVLFECLTGELPFPGKTLSDVIASILSANPDWSRLPVETPREVVRVLDRCLRKDPRKRYHHIADARIELEEASARPADAPPAARGDTAPTGRRWLVSSIVVAALAALLAFLFWGPGQRDGTQPLPIDPLADARITKLTNWPGAEMDAVISPDGQFVAFVSDRDGPYKVFVGRIGTWSYRVLAPEHTSAAWPRVRDVGFVGDGSEVWLSRTPNGMQVVDLMGGPLRTMLDPQAVNAAWSRDGTQLVYHLASGGDRVYLAEATGANPVEIPLPTEEGYHQHYPSWSWDGKWIYLTRGWETTGDVDLWRVPIDGGHPEQLTRERRLVGHPTQIDEQTVLYTAQEPDGSGPWLWALDLESKESRRVATGVASYSSVAASNDGRRIVATVVNSRAQLWSVAIPEQGGAEATEQDVEAYKMPSLRALAPRIRGDDLYYLSSRGAGNGLTRQRGEEVTEIWKGSEAPLLEPAAISPDGKQIALTIRKDKQVRLYVMDAEGQRRRKLTDAVEPLGAADWSPRGDWIVVGGISEGVRGLYKIRADGTRHERILQGPAVNPVWSPDGKSIVFSGAQLAGFLPLMAVSPQGGPVERLHPAGVTRVAGERIRFLPDGSSVVYLSGVRGKDTFHLLDLKTRKSTRIATFDRAATIRTFDITADGKRIIFDRLIEDADIVLIQR